jgi:hypothetical protein
MKSTSNKRFYVEFTYQLKHSGREVFLSREFTGENIEEITVRLSGVYYKLKIESYKEIVDVGT